MALDQKTAIIFTMGFPDWTLWGMGLSIAGALVALLLSLLGQTPSAQRRLGLGGSRLELRVRALTGYALALLLLAIGFFIAGVPLGIQTDQDELSAQLTATAVATLDSAVAEGVPTNSLATEAPAEPTAATPETGAFGGPPEGTIVSTEPAFTATVAAGIPISPTATGVAQSSTLTRQPTATPTHTPTPTPTPEATPTPSLTPTPIAGETAVLSTGGSTVWLHRSPGGQNLQLMHDADIVILHAGHANQGGILWREISTLTGIRGWLQEEFLIISG